MHAATDNLVVVITKGIDSELSSVAFAIANAGLTAGMTVSVFLTSAAIDLVRKSGQRLTKVAPFDSLGTMIESFLSRGGTIWACPPCVAARGYAQSDLLDGVVIAGASAMFPAIQRGAATLSF